MADKPASVRYRVKTKAFINGSLVEPGTYVWAAPGIKGKALEEAPEGGAAPGPAAAPPAQGAIVPSPDTRGAAPKNTTLPGLPRSV